MVNSPISTGVVVTTINDPGDAMVRLAGVTTGIGVPLVVVGDRASPPVYELEGSTYVDLAEQLASPLSLATWLPQGHYARKNVGYLYLIRLGLGCIVETDDDNAPLPGFLEEQQQVIKSRRLSGCGWTNVYRYFTDELVWPRGLPLENVRDALPDYQTLPLEACDCPIQQGLVDNEPDVDAVWRLLFGHQINFRSGIDIVLGEGAWCPFNSQNTRWFEPAFPLLYLPSTCGMRVCDIVRGLVAQRIAWSRGWSVRFTGPTMTQDRNPHDLYRDFTDELPLYTALVEVADGLQALPLSSDPSTVGDDLLSCYGVVASAGLVSDEERHGVSMWLEDLDDVRS